MQSTEAEALLEAKVVTAQARVTVSVQEVKVAAVGLVAWEAAWKGMGMVEPRGISAVGDRAPPRIVS